MNEEKEIKIRILDKINLNELKKIIENIFEIKFKKIKKDRDVYFDLNDNYYFRLNHGLRIRNNEELAYKALFYIPERMKNPWFVLEKEYKLPLSKECLLILFKIANIKCNINLKNKIDNNELKNILQKLNFFEHIKINKVRHIAKNENYEMCIDFVEDLGLFIEIETNEDGYLNYLRKKIPFKYKEIRHGYTNLYAKEVMKMDIPNFKEKFLSNPDWNFLNGQKEIVKGIIKNNKQL